MSQRADLGQNSEIYKNNGDIRHRTFRSAL